MKYFLIAGEASGDLHAAHLMKALRRADDHAQFRYYGGDEMASQGGKLLCHYRNLAYMGFIPVMLHLPQILKGMARCKRHIREWKPDAVILVDYPGFNLDIAQYVKAQALCPVFYYISPKIWAWKEHRIHHIRANVDRLFSILPFEVNFFEKKHHYPISYVGNPTVDEVSLYLSRHDKPRAATPTIALLPGSRQQEIKDNLLRMLRAAAPYTDHYRLVIAAAPAIDLDVYHRLIARAHIDASRVDIVKGQTYHILHSATAALVTSGTATLETALFRVPQVVCYYIACGKLVAWLRRHLLKVPYISLVNLVLGREAVRELVANDMTPVKVEAALRRILPGGEDRQRQLADYEEMARRLGTPGAPERAAREMVDILRRPHS